VIVCDGFTGNVLLKSSEQLAKGILLNIKNEIKSSFTNKIGAWFLKSVFMKLKKKTDPSEFGGALLLGVNGICVIGHGKANSYAVYNALRVSKQAFDQNLNSHIVQELSLIEKESSPVLGDSA
jgi:glycerol-3-phosphate acyltransferase PlsX